MPEPWTDFSPAGRNALAVQYRRLAFLIAKRCVRNVPDVNADDADDLAGVAWLAILRASRSFDEYRGIKFVTFAFAAARNEVVEALRTHRRRGFKQVPKGEYNAPATSWGHEHGPPLTIDHVIDKSDRCGGSPCDNQRIHWSESEWASVLSHVRSEDRRIVYLWAHGWETKDIAVMYGITRSWVWQRLARSLRLLRQRVPGLAGEIEGASTEVK